MGKCNNCGKKIEYNKFKHYRGKVLCYECYDTRLERKRAKKQAAELAAQDSKTLDALTDEFALADGQAVTQPVEKDGDADEQSKQSEQSE